MNVNKHNAKIVGLNKTNLRVEYTKPEAMSIMFISFVNEANTIVLEVSYELDDGIFIKFNRNLDYDIRGGLSVSSLEGDAKLNLSNFNGSLRLHGNHRVYISDDSDVYITRVSHDNPTYFYVYDTSKVFINMESLPADIRFYMYNEATGRIDIKAACYLYDKAKLLYVNNCIVIAKDNSHIVKSTSSRLYLDNNSYVVNAGFSSLFMTGNSRGNAYSLNVITITDEEAGHVVLYAKNPDEVYLDGTPSFEIVDNPITF